VPKEGKGAKEGRIVLEETFAHGRRSFWRKSMRLVAWEALEEAASIQSWRLGAAFTIYLLERLHLWGGRMALAGCLLPGEVSSHQNSLISVAEWSQQQDSHSCGGDLHSSISVEFWSRSGSFRGGAPYISPSGSLSLDSFFILELLLYQVLIVFLFTVKDIALPHIYIISHNWFSPGGFYPGSYDQKYLCLHMHFSCC
jgi:hypothetical protein